MSGGLSKCILMPNYAVCQTLKMPKKKRKPRVAFYLNWVHDSADRKRLVKCWKVLGVHLRGLS